MNCGLHQEELDCEGEVYIVHCTDESKVSQMQRKVVQYMKTDILI